MLKDKMSEKGYNAVTDGHAQTQILISLPNSFVNIELQKTNPM